MDKFNPPQVLSFSRSISEHWKLWKQELMLYIIATEKTKKSDEVKSSILLACIGRREREVYNTFVLMMALWKWISVIFYKNLMIIAPLKKMWLFSDTNFSCIDSQRDNVLIILLLNWRSWIRIVNFWIYRTRLSEIWL